MPKQLVNREDLGRLIAQTSGTVSMINESNYSVRSSYGKVKPNLDGLVHVQIMRATMPSASMYMQLNLTSKELLLPQMLGSMKLHGMPVKFIGNCHIREGQLLNRLSFIMCLA